MKSCSSHLTAGIRNDVVLIMSWFWGTPELRAVSYGKIFCVSYSTDVRNTMI
ncbi:hypothetical protein VCR31J2_150004 [Vibrio coralliirubri]|uniref:Uncharacterized protein n=1 Tax=Vibrio coralliirubri TaxID=1516159 RepID=A0AA86XQ17_9VIBR|nr:hypothetical protein VCR31J2_150004 [Vibrio coralliirubri]